MKLRKLALTLALLAATGMAAQPAFADQGEARAGSSLFGTLKYGPDFKHFDYVNPAAPKGGTLRLSDLGTFDSLNPFIVTGNSVSSIPLIYDTLMKRSLDEPSAEYGLIAKNISYPDDFSSATFELRPEARWHDGKPITSEDVIWSFETLKRIFPPFMGYYADVARAEAIGPNKVKFIFSVKNNRELPNIIGQLYVLPKHYWTSADRNGTPRNIEKTTLEVPLGSGPYRIGNIVPGRTISFERVKDYWGADLPVNVGQNNFDTIRYDFYGDSTIALQAFKADQLDFRLENSAKNWATAYDFPAIKDGRITREELHTDNPMPMQGFLFNIRREKFSDPRVREAFNYAFDFEWENKTLFYGQYTRTASYFPNSRLAATGIPEGRELALLEPFRKDLPGELFTQPYTNPVTDGSGKNRSNLAKAQSLLKSAGWNVKNGVLTNDQTGEPMEVEFLLYDQVFERVVAPYLQNLQRLGVKATMRIADTSQYQNLVDNRKFDIIVGGFAQSLSPGNEQRYFWGCKAAKTDGSRNVIGICDPAIEALIDKVIFASSREELVTATHALDRVLLWKHYLVPQWYSPATRVAYWKRLAHPGTTPAYDIGFPDIWWSTANTDQSGKSGTN